MKVKNLLPYLFLIPLSGFTGKCQLPFEAKSDIFGQVEMKFSRPEWRVGEGASDLFGSINGKETHFFWRGTITNGVKAVFTMPEVEIGPYMYMDDWVNLAMLRNTPTGNYFVLEKSDNGLLIWLVAEAFSRMENDYDTKVLSHIIIYAPDWPKSESFLIYYIEDHQLGVGLDFRAEMTSGLTYDKKLDRYFIKGVLQSYLEVYETQPKLTLEINGMFTGRNFY